MDAGLARYPGSALQQLVPRDAKLPKFDGSFGVEVKLFLDELHHFKCKYGVDDTQMQIYVWQSLEKDAKRWCLMEYACHSPKSWIDLERDMKERFMPQDHDLHMGLTALMSFSRERHLVGC